MILEHQKEFEKQVGKIVLHVLEKETEGGRMKKNEVRKLSIALGDKCYGAFATEEANWGATLETANVLAKILDAWIVNHAPEFSTRKEEKVDYFVKVLKDIGRPDLATKIKSEESTALKTEDSGTTKIKSEESTAIKTEDSGTKRNFIKHTWSEKPIAAPGTKATPDDQGDTVVCTAHAMAKVIFDGLHYGEWTNGIQIDAEGGTEKLVKEKMLHVHKWKRIWASAFHEQLVYVTDQKKLCYEVKLSTKTLFPNNMDDPPKFSEDSYRRLFAILVVKIDDDLHSLYCKKYNAETRLFSCINSHGKDNPTPKYKDDDKRIVCLTLVNATVEELPAADM